MSDYEFNGTIPNFDDAIAEAVSEAIENLNFRDFIDLDDVKYDNDLVDGDRAYDIARDVVDEYGNSESSTDIYELNNMLSQVTEGRDCSDGNPFRDAVKAIINAQILTSGGTGVSDGTPMTIKASGEERQIQAILTRRKEYFREVTEAVYGALTLPIGSMTLASGYSDDGTGRNQFERFHEAYEEEVNNRQAARLREAANSSTIEVNEHLFNETIGDLRRHRAVSTQVVSLLGLLRSLHDGNTGDVAVRDAQALRRVAAYTNEQMPIAERIQSETDKVDDVPH